MNGPTDVQTLWRDGERAFAVIPWSEYQRLVATSPGGPGVPSTPRVPPAGAVPHEVMSLHVEEGLSLRRAWREYLGLTQAEVAKRMEISQPALSQLESNQARPRRITLQRLAKALGIALEQLR